MPNLREEILMQFVLFMAITLLSAVVLSVHGLNTLLKREWFDPVFSLVMTCVLLAIYSVLALELTGRALETYVVIKEFGFAFGGVCLIAFSIWNGHETLRALKGLGLAPRNFYDGTLSRDLRGMIIAPCCTTFSAAVGGAMFVLIAGLGVA